MTLPLPAEAFSRARDVVVSVAGYRITVRTHAQPEPACSPFEWLAVMDLETGMAVLPSRVRELQSDGDFRARVHREAHSVAATGRQGDR